jgi:ferredoxin
MLRKIRICLSVAVFVLLTFYFLDFARILPHKFHVLGHIQFIPALLAVNIGIIVVLIACTLLFGRIYCSFICPMGVFQDIINRFSKLVHRKKKYSYRKNNPILRWSIVVIVLILYLLGFTIILGIVDPYSAYGRMATHLFKPIYLLCNNVLASIFNNFGNYTFYRVEIAMLSLFSLIISVLTLLIIGVLAWTKGRLYCNTICPVGTILGFISKYSFFKIRIKADECVSCGICSKKCKALCIDTQTKTIDYTRCVNCFNCMDSCSQKGMSFSINKAKNKQQTDGKKRQFLVTGLTAALAIPAAWVHVHKKTELFVSKKGVRNTPISPPGAISTEHLLKHCTSCHLCISKCPSKVLKPAFMEYGIGGMMQPIMSFEKGFCNFNCTRCSNVCPSKALVPLTIEQKHLTQVGRVVFRKEDCIIYTNGYNCGACSEHCPTQAVKMIPYKNGLTIPHIDPDICVGCGGCEFICPVAAIYVEGNEIHQQAKAFLTEEKYRLLRRRSVSICP